MKVNVLKTANNKLWPADEEAEEKIGKIKNGEVYKANITINQNYRLHKKMFAFFKYCAQFYYGDQEVDNNQVDYTRRQLLIASGYTNTMVDPRSGFIEITAASLKYEKMPPEERSDCYKKLVNSALKNVFHSADDEVYNQLMSFF